MADINRNDIGSVDELKRSFERLGQPIPEILNAIGNMYDESEKLNNAFLQGRTRLDEMNDAISKSAAGVIRLNGNAGDVRETLTQIAEGSRRNVIATEEQVSKIYAATQILGGTSSRLVENFANVGYEVSQIGTNLEDSISYIQSVGLNAKDVMGDVTDNMEKMNRFNFEGGVQGLAKMAAQASMVRLDMSATLGFAEDLYKPERAIEVSAAFQRLGIAVGQLADPFALMNASINDPGALQDSLINATKQFTYFDEKTKSFRISPQGILTLKEMATETGISFEQLSKTALAAADLDKRISNINPSLQFDKEEDKQLLANMATMKDGEYVVQIKDDKGAIEYKKLGDITADEFKELRKKQEEAPKTLEEIQISQLDVQKNIEAGINALVAKGTYGIAGASIIRGNITGAERITRAVTSSVDKNVPESAIITKSINDVVKKMSELFTTKDLGKISNKDFASKLTKLENEIKDKSISLGEKGFDTLKNILRDTNEKITGKSGIEKEFKEYATEILSTLGVPEKSSNTSKIVGTKTTEPIDNSRFFGGKSFGGTSQKTGGVLPIDIAVNISNNYKESNNNDSELEVKRKKQLKEYIESPEFARELTQIIDKQNKKLERTK
jgi:hypothetical protein